MRLTRAHFATLRDFPSDAEVISHKLMAKAGLILKLAAGVYTYGPIFWRTLSKIRRIVTEEMDRTGAIEMCMPILQPQELWQRSGRLENYTRSGILWRAKDRRDGTFALGPTHEEVITDFMDRTVNSYRQLPLNLYQVQTKFRDELRPRFGLMRCREFVMKDAYSFDRDGEGLDRSYEKMRDAYRRIFRRTGLDFIVVQADAGDIGGSGSEEFMVTASSGEDAVLYCGDAACSYAANGEKAQSRFPDPHAGEAAPLRKESTPGIKTVEQLCGFFPELTASRMVKTILYNCAMPGREDFETVAVLIRGDQDINEVKVTGTLGALSVELADDETVQTVTGAAVGFAGPLGFRSEDGKDFRIRVVADETVRGMTNFLCGCNETDFHCLDVNLGRDLPPLTYHDLRAARTGEPCPVCGKALEEARGIEVGHIFKLGTKYSAAMKATFLDEQGKSLPFVMGCYGIGVSRIAAAAIEQNHDDRGIIWPAAIAPYHVHLLALNIAKDDIRGVCEDVYRDLLALGVEVLFDDRKGVSAGVKFADADLLGLPWRINVGRTAKEGKVELVERATGERTLRPAGEVAAWLAERCLVEGRPALTFPEVDAHCDGAAGVGGDGADPRIGRPGAGELFAASADEGEPHMFGWGSAKTALGIDIGSSAIKVVQLKKGSPKPTLTGLAICPLQRGAVSEGTVVDFPVVAAKLQDLLEEKRFATDNAVACLPARGAHLRFLMIPPLKDKDLSVAASEELENSVPCSLDNAVVELFRVGRVEAQEVLHDLVFALVAPNEAVTTLQKVFGRIDLEVTAVDLDILAVLNAIGPSLGVPSTDDTVLREGAGGQRIAVLASGAGTTSMSILDNGIHRFYRAISLAGDNVTSIFMQYFKEEFDHAETMKIESGVFPEKGGSSSDPDFDEMARSTLEWLANEIRRCFEFHRRRCPGDFKEKVVLTGGTALLPGLAPFLEKELSMEVALADPLQGLEVDLPDTDLLDARLQQCTAAIGLAMRGLS